MKKKKKILNTEALRMKLVLKNPEYVRGWLGGFDFHAKTTDQLFKSVFSKASVKKSNKKI
jgi:hypothetical protein